MPAGSRQLRSLEARLRTRARRASRRICASRAFITRSIRFLGGLTWLAVDSGITSHAVASAFGHESFKTIAESYAKREAVAGAQQKRALAVLTGGRLAS